MKQMLVFLCAKPVALSCLNCIKTRGALNCTALVKCLHIMKNEGLKISKSSEYCTCSYLHIIFHKELIKCKNIILLQLPHMQCPFL